SHPLACPPLLPRTPSLVAFHFFLHRSGPLRALHSFPTRRSSDLAAAQRERSIRATFAPAFFRRYAAVMPVRPAPMIATYLLKKADRKSTRLNSSHVATSYAGFCLKKKTSV